ATQHSTSSRPFSSGSAQLMFHLHPKQGVAFCSKATEPLYGGAAGVGRSHLIGTASFVRALFDHLVGACEEGGGYGEAEHLGGSEVDHHFELGRLLDRKVGRLGALENLVDVVSSTPRQVSEIRPVGDEATGCHKFSNSMKRWQLLPGREVRNVLSITS